MIGNSRKDIPAKLARQYQLRFAATREYRNLVWRILCDDFFSRYIAEDAKILDLGSGWGEFINNIAAAEKFAMDLNEAAINFIAEGITCFLQDCSYKWPLASGCLDVVFTSNFFEHLDDKTRIERTIAEAHRCLKDGGLLICLGPNIKFVSGAYWDFWDHRIPLTESSCAEVLQMNNFVIEQCLDRFLPYSMSTGRTPPLFLVKLYLRLPVLWSVLGKQFLVVGRKEPKSAGSASQ